MLGLSEAPDVYLRLAAIVFAALVAAAALHLIRALIDATENAERHARAHRCTSARRPRRAGACGAMPRERMRNEKIDIASDPD